MLRHEPDWRFRDFPCGLVAVSCAKGEAALSDIPSFGRDGYLTLAGANKFIRSNLRVRKRTDYKRGERPKLKDLHLDGKGIVCLFGHFVYVDREEYWSFFENKEDEVVAVWELKEAEEVGET